METKPTPKQRKSPPIFKQKKEKQEKIHGNSVIEGNKLEPAKEGYENGKAFSYAN